MVVFKISVLNLILQDFITKKVYEHVMLQQAWQSHINQNTRHKHSIHVAKFRVIPHSHEVFDILLKPHH